MRKVLLMVVLMLVGVAGAVRGFPGGSAGGVHSLEEPTLPIGG